MKKSYIIICFIIIILIILFIYLKSTYQIQHQCDLKGCPIYENQNDLYKIYINYKSIREKNYKLANPFYINCGLNNIMCKGPSNIFIIRHAERNYIEELPLNYNGILRSTDIPNLIKNINKMEIGVNCIIAPNNYKVMHEEQTILLTSWLLNIPLFMYGINDETEKAVTSLFTNPYFNGKTVLLCWKHTCIQKLVKNIIDIGSKVKNINNYQFINPEGNNKLPYWEYNDYDTLFYFDNKLNFHVLKTGLKTCDTNKNYKIIYGKKQICE